MPEPGDLHAVTTDHQFRSSEGRGQMPDKQPGKHRWIVIATFTSSREDLMASTRGEQVHLDQENLLGVQSGCIDCEEPWPSPEPCKAEEYPWDR